MKSTKIKLDIKDGLIIPEKILETFRKIAEMGVKEKQWKMNGVNKVWFDPVSLKVW